MPVSFQPISIEACHPGKPTNGEIRPGQPVETTLSKGSLSRNRWHLPERRLGRVVRTPSTGVLAPRRVARMQRPAIQKDSLPYHGTRGNRPPFRAISREQPSNRGSWAALMIALLGLLSLWNSDAAQAAESDAKAEYNVKAVFLLNFARFVEWPEKSLPTLDEPLVIGVLGDNPFGGLIEQAIRGETLHGRRMEFRHFPSLMQDFPSAHVLFVSRSENNKLPTVIRELKNSPVLIVGEADRFAHRGGMINFVTVDKNVRFEVNPEEAERAGLKLSSKLLNLPKAIRVSASASKQ
jgi:YfiR/HmsC-like